MAPERPGRMRTDQVQLLPLCFLPSPRGDAGPWSGEKDAERAEVPQTAGGTAASHPDPGLYFFFLINRFLGSLLYIFIIDMLGSLSKQPWPA